MLYSASAEEKATATTKTFDGCIVQETRVFVSFPSQGAAITTITVTAIVFVIGQQLIMPMVRGNFDTFLWLKLLNLW